LDKRAYCPVAAFSPDGKTLGLAGLKLDNKDTKSFSGVVLLWDVGAKKERWRSASVTPSILGLGFSPDGKTLVCADWAQTVSLLEVATGKELRRFKAALRAGELWDPCAAVSPGGTVLAIAGSSREPEGSERGAVRSIFGTLERARSCAHCGDRRALSPA
jgi:WD40 repeat protein